MDSTTGRVEGTEAEYRDERRAEQAGDAARFVEAEPGADLYADAELRRRHERTTLMIRKAQQQGA